MSLLALLRERRLIELERRLNGLVNAASAEPTTHEFAALNAFEAFSITDPSLEPLLDEWVDSSSSPPLAYSARAVYLDARAWAARGGAWGRETSREAFAEMARWHERATRDARVAVRQRPELASAWGVLISASQSDHARFDAVAREALRAQPASLVVRSKVLAYLQPRWGGSYDEMEQLVALTRPFFAVNGNLRRLENRVALDRADVALDRDDVEAAESWLVDAAVAGGEDWRLYEARAALRRKQRRTSEALEDIERALELRPDEPDLVSDRVRLLFTLGRDRDAALGVARLAALDPTARALDGWRARLAREDADACEALARGDDAPSAALVRCDAALAMHPADEGALFWKGRALLALHRESEAETVFAAALVANPRSRRAIENLDWMLGKRGDWGRIVRLWDDYLALEPDDAKAWLERAGTHHHRGDENAACRDLARSCQLGSTTACDLARRNCPGG